MKPNSKQPNVKERIILTAEKLFAANGYDATSVNAIIAQADVSKGGFYHHFSSKEDVIRAIIQYESSKQEYYPNFEHLPNHPKEKLTMIIELWFSGIAQTKSIFPWLFPLLFQPKMKHILSHLLETEGEKPANFLIQIFTELGIKNPEMEAQLFLYLFAGIKMDIALKKELDLNSIKQFLLHKYI